MKPLITQLHVRLNNLGLIVLSATEEGLLEKAKSLLSAKNVVGDYMDIVDIPKICLILNSNRQEHQVDPESIKQLGSLISTIAIDFHEIGIAEQVPNIWRNIEIETSLSGYKGKGLKEMLNQQEVETRISTISSKALGNLSKFLNANLAPLVFKSIEERMKNYEKDVAGPKRGLSNRFFKVSLKYFASSKQNPSVQDGPILDKTTQKLIFPHFSTVMSLRRLADFAFMIGDFKYSQSILLLLKKDLESNEKYVKYHAGVQV